MLFCFGILLREFDIDTIGESPIWESVETLVRAITVIAWLIYLVSLLKKMGVFWKNRTTILTSPMVLLTLLACIIYISGWPFDKALFPIAVDFAVFVEETLELNATLLLFLSSTLTHGAYAPSSLSPARTTGNHSL